MAPPPDAEAAAEAGESASVHTAFLKPPSAPQRDLRAPPSAPPAAARGPRRVLWAGACVFLGVGALLAAAAAVHMDAPKQRNLKRYTAPFATADEVKVACGRMEIGVDFASQGSTLKQGNVTSAAECCSLCEAESSCGMWTWGMVRGAAGLSDVCFMKEPPAGDAEPFGAQNEEVVSGLSPRMQQFANLSVKVAEPSLMARNWDSSNGSQLATEYRSASLFCFALAIPDSYEVKLLRYQYEDHASIFACDEYAIYSNAQIDVAPDVATSIVQSDLQCSKGGEFGTALNLKIFLAVWTKVINDGRFRYHGWTVKVDPDSVFFPQRLRGLLAYQNESIDGGVYLNNCKYGLHGPLEVFSRTAVQAWALGSAKCVRHFTQVCSGDCFWGEDMFIDQCLWKVLKVKRADEFRLLTEDHCDAPSDWRSCRDSIMVAFHPFKSLDDWKSCMANATS